MPPHDFLSCVSCVPWCYALDCGAVAALLQHERHVTLATLGPKLSATSRNHDVLPAVDFIRTRRGKPRGWKLELPKQLSTLAIEGAQHLVARRGNKDEPASRHERASIVFGAGWRDTLRR